MQGPRCATLTIVVVALVGSMFACPGLAQNFFDFDPDDPFFGNGNGNVSNGRVTTRQVVRTVTVPAPHTEIETITTTHENMGTGFSRTTVKTEIDRDGNGSVDSTKTVTIQEQTRGGTTIRQTTIKVDAGPEEKTTSSTTRDGAKFTTETTVTAGPSAGQKSTTTEEQQGGTHVREVKIDKDGNGTVDRIEKTSTTRGAGGVEERTTTVEDPPGTLQETTKVTSRRTPGGASQKTTETKDASQKVTFQASETSTPIR